MTKYLRVLFFLFMIVVTIKAQHLQAVLNTVRCTIYCLIPTVSVLMFVLAAVAYMFGQYFGAEIRARAIGYSTSLIVGAIVAFLIVQLSNAVIGVMFPGVTLGACVC